MKILRILLIILIPAMGIVGCRKSYIQPASPGGHECSSKSSATSSSNDNVAGREALDPIEEPELGGDATEIYGSGDDDRNGGEKRKKRQ